MNRLLASVLFLTLSACAPTTTAVAVSWGPNPWYSYCTWDAPCWYSDHVVFIYGWGYVERPTYVYLYEHPGRREGWTERRREWHPDKQPQYRGRDWDAYKSKRDAEHVEHHNHGKHDRDDR